MDRHKQQIKRDRQDLKRREINSQNKSRMRTLIKSVLSEKDANKAKNLYGLAISIMVLSGIILLVLLLPIIINMFVWRALMKNKI